jgi:peptidoglycan/xylan/chitin deacetylase (PgdA/CDA1 family)
MNVGLTVDTVGNPSEYKLLLDTLSDFNIESTFFVCVKIESEAELIKLIYKNGHEIGNHTYSHPIYLSRLSYREKELEIKSTHLFLDNILRQVDKKIEIKGFRAPFYNFDPDIFGIIEKNNYMWDSTKAYFPVLGSSFQAEKIGKIVELPSLFPDDSTMIIRLGLNEKKVLKIWKKSYDLSKNTFIWGIHPYLSAKNSSRINMLKNFIEYILNNDGNFLTLSEIAKKV